jgi:hypothetical protein
MIGLAAFGTLFHLPDLPGAFYDRRHLRLVFDLCYNDDDFSGCL